jgi:hypothetical protein
MSYMHVYCHSSVDYSRSLHINLLRKQITTSIVRLAFITRPLNAQSAKSEKCSRSGSNVWDFVLGAGVKNFCLD